MKREFWFVVGSQFLYGPETLEIVDRRAAEMAAELSTPTPSACCAWTIWRISEMTCSSTDPDR